MPAKYVTVVGENPRSEFDAEGYYYDGRNSIDVIERYPVGFRMAK